MLIQRVVFLILCLALLLAGCRPHGSSPAGGLERLANAHVALLQLKAKLSTPDSSLTPSAYSTRVDDTLRVYGFTRAQFAQEMDTLANQPEALKRFTDLVKERTK